MNTLNAPTVSGLHHLKLPVSNLDTSLDWYRRVFGAQHLPQFDHFDNNGARYAVILAIPGLSVPLELRWAPGGATALRGCDPINLAAESAEALQAWAQHLDSLDVEHSSVIQGGAGHLLVLADPDGIYIRISEVYQPAASKTSKCPRAIPSPTTHG
ncbi:MAG TPA: VOC family protein [Mycobacterium sp.]|nr:VOC family protein [Mycobacterium sp.]